jgi:hypothetical protein
MFLVEIIFSQKIFSNIKHFTSKQMAPKSNGLDGKKPNSVGEKESVSCKAEPNATVEAQTSSKSLDGSQLGAVDHRRSKLTSMEKWRVKEGEVGGAVGTSKAGKKVDFPAVPRPKAAANEVQDGVEAETSILLRRLQKKTPRYLGLIQTLPKEKKNAAGVEGVIRQEGGSLLQGISSGSISDFGSRGKK